MLGPERPACVLGAMLVSKLLKRVLAGHAAGAMSVCVCVCLSPQTEFWGRSWSGTSREPGTCCILMGVVLGLGSAV